MNRTGPNSTSNTGNGYNYSDDLEQQYLPEFERLSNASLQKYKMFFGLECTEEELIEKVKNHFMNSLELNQNLLYERLFKLKREEREELKNRKTLRAKKENPKSNF